jgi:hypothetical protein
MLLCLCAYIDLFAFSKEYDMDNKPLPEILVSVDGEFTGPIPGKYSMISLGAVAYHQDGIEISTFKTNIKELPGALCEPDTMKWWSGQQAAWNDATKDPIDPGVAMQNFAQWLKQLPGTPKLIGWPLPVDFLFVYWYYVYFTGERPPFGYDGIDVKTFAMSFMGKKTLEETSKDALCAYIGIIPKILSHDPVDDARWQAELYFRMAKSLA